MSSSRLLTKTVLGLTALIAPILLAGCDRQSEPKAQPQAGAESAAPAGVVDRSHKGSRLPELSFRDATGKELRLASLIGKPLLINLWATWCAPCVAELPALGTLATSTRGQLTVLPISQDFGEPASVATFLKDKGVRNLPAWLDPENTLASHYQATTLPATIYYDAQGREVWRFTGSRDWLSKETAALLAEAGK